MHISRLAIGVAVVGSTFALDLPTAGADLTVNSWGLLTQTGDAIGAGAGVIDNTVINPFNLASTATDGGASSKTTYDFAWDDVGGDGGSFNWDFDQERVGAAGSSATSGAFLFDGLRFTVTGQDMLYDLSGAYAMMGGGTISGAVSLRDTTTGFVFGWSQQSNSTLNESFVVGQGGGDATDFVDGSQSGTLVAGHTYELTYVFVINNSTLIADSGATADGNLQMNITPIPAPGAALLAALGLPMVGWAKRRFA